MNGRLSSKEGGIGSNGLSPQLVPPALTCPETELGPFGAPAAPAFATDSRDMLAPFGAAAPKRATSMVPSEPGCDARRQPLGRNQR